MPHRRQVGASQTSQDPLFLPIHFFSEEWEGQPFLKRPGPLASVAAEGAAVRVRVSFFV